VEIYPENFLKTIDIGFIKTPHPGGREDTPQKFLWVGRG